MSITTVELKMKKEKLSKKRKVAELSEIPGPSIVPILPFTKDPHSMIEAKGRTESPNVEEPNLFTNDPPREPRSKKQKVFVKEIEIDVSKPEPPSKRALRRLKKRKPPPPPKSGTETSSEPEEWKLRKPEAEKRSKHGVWIGNLPWNITKANLRSFLTSALDITDDTITRIYMPSPSDDKLASKAKQAKSWNKQYNKGFAYVDFSRPEFVQQAIELSEQLLSGRRVLIKDNKSFEGRPQKTKEESRNEGKPPSRRVFLGNLRFDTTEGSLKEHFEKCGAIENIMVATFEDSGKCKGYAWITFEELEAAESAVRGYALVTQEDKDMESNPKGVDEWNSRDEEGKEEAAIREEPRMPAVKKWWVDRIHKRPVRREFAEDAHVRYQKRYGRDGAKGKITLNGAANLNSGKGGGADNVK